MIKSDIFFIADTINTEVRINKSIHNFAHNEAFLSEALTNKNGYLYTRLTLPSCTLIDVFYSHGIYTRYEILKPEI